MKINVEKIGGEWGLTFSHGVQGFRLAYAGTKKECEWFKKCLKTCFEQYAKQEKIKLLEKYSISTKGGRIFRDSALNEEFKNLKDE